MNKILRSLSLAVLPLGLTGCWTASIWTVAPTTEYVAPVKTVYTTQVTTPQPKVTTTTTVTVTSFNNDRSFYLDLQAVGAAFAESRSVQEFEQLLNSSRYMINNLDLNGDGYIDYLRVLETHEGYYHTFLIQACLGHSLYQDVATLIAEYRPNALYVEVIGDRWLYGANYIVRPVFVKRPPLWDVFGRPVYTPWYSPYYYGYWPSYYHQPKPVYLSHYQAYVVTYMSNHHYCHHCDYPSQPYYNGYTQMTQSHTRNDYARQHPGDSFEQRVTHTLTANGSGVTVRNAGQLRTESQRQQSQTRETGTSSGSRSSSTQSGTSGASARTTQGTQSTTQNAQRTPSSTQSTERTKSTTQSTERTQSGSQSTPRTASTTQSGQSAQRTTATEQTRQPSTSVTTRVSKSGTTRTTVKQTDANGRTTTVKRTSTPARTSSTSTSTQRSSSSTQRSSGTTRTSGGSSNTRR